MDDIGYFTKMFAGGKEIAGLISTGAGGELQTAFDDLLGALRSMEVRWFVEKLMRRRGVNLRDDHHGLASPDVVSKVRLLFNNDLAVNDFIALVGVQYDGALVWHGVM